MYKEVLQLTSIPCFAYRQWSEEVDLMKGFRYELTVYHFGNGKGPDFFHLGVEFPDKTEEKPISKNYLWRSMGMRYR